MKHSLLAIVLAILGVLLLVIILQARPIINWDKLDPELSNHTVVSNEQVIQLLKTIHERGELYSYINQTSYVLLNISLTFIFFGTFVFAHLWIEKLFYRKFYEMPDYWNALRRGILFTIIPVISLNLALNNLLRIEIIAIIILILIILEILMQRRTRGVEIESV